MRIWPLRAPRLSVCMIVRDEADNLPGILGDVRSFADEIIVVDTGSVDNTKEIAQAFGAKVFDFPWRDDFSAARNHSLDKATGDLCMWVDADDRISPFAFKHSLKMGRAYYVEVHNSDGAKFYQRRIIPNDKRLRFRGRVHESIYDMRGYESDHLPGVAIWHTGYWKPELVAAKLARNLRLMELEENPGYTVRFAHAETLVTMRRIDEAMALYRGLAEDWNCKIDQPDISHAAVIGVAGCNMLLGNRERANEWAGWATAIRPFDIQGWYYLGMTAPNDDMALYAFGQGLQCNAYVSSLPMHHAWFVKRCQGEASKRLARRINGSV